eukprot:3201661-Lingulodinium_polyedra.AAC.1
MRTHPCLHALRGECPPERLPAPKRTRAGDIAERGGERLGVRSVQTRQSVCVNARYSGNMRE